MPAPYPSLPKAPAPTKIFFDPFNSSSTGHQIAASTLAGSASWRNSRTYKLTSQFEDSSGRGGPQHLLDLVGAGSKDFGKDGRKENGHRERDASGLRENGWQDIRGMMSGPRKRGSEEAGNSDIVKESKLASNSSLDQQRHTGTQRPVSNSQRQEAHLNVKPDSATNLESAKPPKQPPRVFRGLTIYINGSTAPLISDHKLKNLFVSHGGNVCLGLARRSVTHVILGETGLAAGKIQKEVRKIRGESVRYVTAQWVIDSVEAGKRKSEGPYTPKELGIGGSRQRSVRQVFSKMKDK